MTGLICCTLECNLACKYCFEGNGNDRNYPQVDKINNIFAMAMNKIDDFIDQLYQHNRGHKTTIIWHGGEPTLIRPQLLDELMTRQVNKGQNIHWAIQTNGTILSEELINVYVKHNVNVGISMDGLKETHDCYRITKSGKPTFEIIMKNIERLKKVGIIPNILLTISDKNVNDLLRIYQYLVENNSLSFTFNALYPNTHENDAVLDVERYSESICDLFDIWISDERNKKLIIPFLRIIEGLMYPQCGISVCHWRRDCSKTMISIDVLGNLYNCEHWVDKKEFCIGNISEGLEKCLDQNNLFRNRAENLKENDCKKCEIFKLCYGGCPSNAYELCGDYNRYDSSICEGRKHIIKHIYSYIRKNTNYKLPDFSEYGGD